ncbi:putative MFS family arabinose efflux permease [Streptomyces sp. 846.5]|nr:MFS transporter [Streptomyces sp. 846.5]TDU02285.1 putative MFS family arabinose efflux permease [Streptomyces sp. 846.5]
MRTYQELFRTPEFTPFFLASSAQVAASTVSGLALGTLVFGSTGSPLLSSLAMFGPSLAQLVGAATLLSAADRLPPRAAMSGLALLFALGTVAQAIPGLPVWAAFALLAGQGLLASLGGGVRYGLLNEIVVREGYLLGRSLLNMAAGTMQICGYAAGGLLLAGLSPRGTLLVGAALYTGAALLARFGLGARPARSGGRPSVAATWRTNARLWSAKPRRYVYLALWVPNGLIVGAESLFVPYAPGRSGLLFAFAALGMLAGDTLTGRFVPARWRERLGAPLRLLLAAPYLVFALHPDLPLALLAVMLASVGYAASLLLQERLMSLVPQELSGHALGLHSSGMLAMQGVGAALAGAVATRTSPSTAMALMALLSLAVTLWLAPGLRGGGGTGGQQPPQSQHSQHWQHSSASQQSASQQSMSLHGPWRRRPLQGSS